MLHTRYNETHQTFSPNGRWLAYVSNQSGRSEVYVRAFPDSGPAVQISTGGGTRPTWSRDGQEIVFRHDDKFFSARVHEEDGTLLPEAPVEFHQGRYGASYPLRSYDLASDGRLLVIEQGGSDSANTIIDALMPTEISLVHNSRRECLGNSRPGPLKQGTKYAETIKNGSAQLDQQLSPQRSCGSLDGQERHRRHLRIEQAVESRLTRPPGFGYLHPGDLLYLSHEHDYNINIVNIRDALSLPEGPERTAALVAWLQGLYDEETPVPVLVGGAAVELLTGGAYTTGDLDFIGEVPEAVALQLSQAGFEKKGRHWIHHEGQVFLEFPGGSLEADEDVIALDAAGQRILVLSPEAVLVDRLAAWEFWNSTIDAANAFLVLRATGNGMDREKLNRLVESRDVSRAWASLDAFNRRFSSREPKPEELVEWAESLGS